jgi:hypothetical protein
VKRRLVTFGELLVFCVSDRGREAGKPRSNREAKLLERGV